MNDNDKMKKLWKSGSFFLLLFVGVLAFLSGLVTIGTKQGAISLMIGSAVMIILYFSKKWWLTR